MATLPPLPTPGVPRLPGAVARPAPPLPGVVGRSAVAHGATGQVGALHNPQSAIGVGQPTTDQLLDQMSALLFYRGEWKARPRNTGVYGPGAATAREAMERALCQ